MSIKGLLVAKLQEAFGTYIEGLDSQNLKMSVMAGTIEQSNLRLKSSALAALQLPITVSAGFLGRFYVKVPWTNLANESVQVEISDVFLLAAPNHECGGGPDDEEARVELLKAAVVRKLSKITQEEALRQALVDEEDNTMATRLQHKVADNLKVIITNVHIRFEDVPAGTGATGAHAVCFEAHGACAGRRTLPVAKFVQLLVQGVVPDDALVWGTGASALHGARLDSFCDPSAVTAENSDEFVEMLQETGATIVDSPVFDAPGARPVAVGIKMDKLTIHTTDEAGRECFVVDGGAQNKVVKMSGFAVYTENPPPCAQLGPMATSCGEHPVPCASALASHLPFVLCSLVVSCGFSCRTLT